MNQLLRVSCENLVKELHHKVCVEQKLNQSQIRKLKVDVEFQLKVLPSNVEEGAESVFLVCADSKFGTYIYLAEYFGPTGGWYTEESSFYDKINYFVRYSLDIYRSKESSGENFDFLICIFDYEFQTAMQS